VIVFACIAPLGEVDLDPSVRSAMEELGLRFEAAAPDVAVVVTPYSVHVECHLAVVSPARDRTLEEHLRLGKAIAALPARVALVASADHGHAHDPDGPCGFDPAAAAYDAQLQGILSSDCLVVRRRRVGENVRARRLADGALEDDELPERVGLGGFDEVRERAKVGMLVAEIAS
jgi:hypothetical protein